MSVGDATKVLRSQGILPCIDCKYAMLPYANDDFHINAQCWSPQNRTIKVSPVTHNEYPEYKAQFCKDTRSDERFCGPKGVWFEPRANANTVVEEKVVGKKADGTKSAKSSNPSS